MVRINIKKNFNFKETSSKKFTLKFFLFFLVFNFYFVLVINPVFCDQDNTVSQKEIVLINKKLASLDKKIRLQKEREEKLAQKKSAVEAKKAMAFANEFRLQKEREEKLAQKKSTVEAKKAEILAKKELLEKQREQKIAEKESDLRLKREKAAFEKNVLIQERNRKLAEKQAAAEVRIGEQLVKKAKLQKEREEKEAQDDYLLHGSPIAEYMCVKGINAYKLGDYDIALGEFQKALLVEPDNQVAKKYIKNSLEAMGQVENIGSK